MPLPLAQLIEQDHFSAHHHLAKSISIYSWESFSDFHHCNTSYIAMKSMMERNFNTSLFTNIQCKNLVKCWVRTTSVRFYMISAQAFVCLAQRHQYTTQMSATFPLRKQLMNLKCSPGAFLHSILIHHHLRATGAHAKNILQERIGNQKAKEVSYSRKEIWCSHHTRE